MNSALPKRTTKSQAYHDRYPLCKLDTPRAEYFAVIEQKTRANLVYLDLVGMSPPIPDDMHECDAHAFVLSANDGLEQMYGAFTQENVGRKKHWPVWWVQQVDWCQKAQVCMGPAVLSDSAHQSADQFGCVELDDEALLKSFRTNGGGMSNTTYADLLDSVYYETASAMCMFVRLQNKLQGPRAVGVDANNWKVLHTILKGLNARVLDAIKEDVYAYVSDNELDDTTVPDRKMMELWVGHAEEHLTCRVLIERFESHALSIGSGRPPKVQKLSGEEESDNEQ